MIMLSRSTQRQVTGMFHHLTRSHDDLQRESTVKSCRVSTACLFVFPACHILKASCCELSLTTAGEVLQRAQRLSLKLYKNPKNITNYFCCSARAKPGEQKNSRNNSQKNGMAQTTLSKAGIALLFARNLKHLGCDLNNYMNPES